MRTSLNAIVFLWAMSITAVAGNRTDPDPDPILRAESLRNEGKLFEAEAVLNAALQDAERAGGQDVRFAFLLNNLANVTGALGRSGRSERLYLRAIRLWKHLGMADTPHCARSVSGLVTEYFNTSQFAKAEALYERELRRFEQLTGLGDRERARILHLAGAVAHARGNLDLAETLYLQAVALFEKGGETTNAEKSAVLNTLATVHFRTSRYESALALLTRARSMVETSFGKEGVQLVGILINYGAFVRDFAESEASLLEALRIAESRLGPGHPDVALVLTAYAERLRRAGRKKNAVAFERRARQILSHHQDTVQRRHKVDLSELVGGRVR
jgi:tetratricopeptide (TPR) repeat protein